MTTWDLASEADKTTIRLLIEQLQQSGHELPPLPTSAREAELAGLTKRDAGKLTTLLREAIRDAGA